MDQYNQGYPDYSAQVYDQPPQPPQRNTTRIVLIVLGVLLVLCCCCVGGGLLFYYVLGDMITDAMGLTQMLTPWLSFS